MSLASKPEGWLFEDGASADKGWTVGWANGTPDTPITLNNAGAFSNTAAILCIDNLDPLGGRTIIPKWATMSIIGVDTTSTSARIYGVVDSKVRYASGGTQLIIPEFGFKRPDLNGVTVGNIVAAPAPAARVVFGAVVVSAPSAFKQNVISRIIKTQTPAFIAGDNITFNFAKPSSAGHVLSNATASHYVVHLGGVSIPPQCSFVLHFWEPGITTAPTAEIDGEHLEV